MKTVKSLISFKVYHNLYSLHYIRIFTLLPNLMTTSNFFLLLTIIDLTLRSVSPFLE